MKKSTKRHPCMNEIGNYKHFYEKISKIQFIDKDFLEERINVWGKIAKKSKEVKWKPLYNILPKLLECVPLQVPQRESIEMILINRAFHELPRISQNKIKRLVEKIEESIAITLKDHEKIKQVIYGTKSTKDKIISEFYTKFERTHLKGQGAPQDTAMIDCFKFLLFYSLDCIFNPIFCNTIIYINTKKPVLNEKAQLTIGLPVRT